MVETVQSSDGAEFLLDSETRWMKRQRTGNVVIDLIAWLKNLGSLTSLGPISVPDGQPSWLIVLKEGDAVIARSNASDDWPSVERTLAAWKKQIAETPADDVRTRTWPDPPLSRRHLA